MGILSSVFDFALDVVSGTLDRAAGQAASASRKAYKDAASGTYNGRTLSEKGVKELNKRGDALAKKASEFSSNAAKARMKRDELDDMNAEDFED